MISLAAPQKRARPGPDPGWKVPPHLVGLRCQLCHSVFKDGDDHGRLDFATSALVCRVDHYAGIPYAGVRPLVDIAGASTCFRAAAPRERPTGKKYRVVRS
jgi:hypothetical protein